MGRTLQLIAAWSFVLLAFSCEKETPEMPFADFTFTGGNCSAPCNVQFINNSTSPDSTTYTWFFGDGRVVYDTMFTNVRHRYTTAGIYQVKLQARIGEAVSEKTAFVTVRGTGVDFRPIVDFEITNNNCKAPCDAGIVNLTTGATEYEWKVDGDIVSINENLQSNFTSPGSYNIELTAKNKYGERKLTKEVIIECGSRASLTRLTLESIPWRRSNGQSWDLYSCCPDIEVRIRDVDQNLYLATSPIAENASTPGIFWNINPILQFNNSNTLVIELWDLDDSDYEFVGKTNEFVLDDNPQICESEEITVYGSGNVRVLLTLKWEE